MSVFLLVLGLLLFVGLVIVHEFGHFIAARRNGIDVEEFGIGFPPKAKTLARKNGTEYTLNWLPLGGFVKLKGEHDADTAKGSFGAASLKAKVKVMLAGVGMNLITAFVLLTFLALIGMPQLLENQFAIASDTKVMQRDVLIGYIEPNSPASKASRRIFDGKAGEAVKLQERDKIITIRSYLHHMTTNGSLMPADAFFRIRQAEDVKRATEKLSPSPILITIERDGKQLEVYSELRGKEEVEASKNSDSPKGYLGIIPTEYTIQRSTWSAPIVAIGFMKQATEATLKGIGSALAGLFSGNTSKATEQVSGPVGIFVVLKEGSLIGIRFILMIIAVISLTLAIMNALPIPALDGGRLFVTLIYRGLKKPLTARTEELIHGSGFALLMVLFVLITFVDVRRFF